jgi:hypothetical protein
VIFIGSSLKHVLMILKQLIAIVNCISSKPIRCTASRDENDCERAGLIIVLTKYMII